MLIFVGLGLWDEEDITLKGLNAIRKADVVYAEFYTSMLCGTTIEKMERLYGRRINILDRKDLEEESSKLIEEAMEKDVVVLTAGDPMIATTHNMIRLEAKKKGVEVDIIHNASIVSAVCGITGLHNYRFGKSATIARPYKNTIPRTPLDVIKSNQLINAHTLLFLDTNPPMSIEEAVKLMKRIDDGTFDHYAVGIARAGGENIVKCDKFYKLEDYDFGEPLHVMVFLAKTLHITEYECLIEFANAPKEIEELVE